MLVPIDYTLIPPREVDPDATLLEYLKVVRVTDVHSAACHLFDVQHPTRASMERTRRRLDRMATAGTVAKAPGSSGGQAGGVVTLYRLLPSAGG
jgi:hypothetical protein